jgi:hypothetical protein
MKQTNDETRSKGRPSILLLRSNRFPKRGPLGSQKTVFNDDNGSEVVLQIF